MNIEEPESASNTIGLSDIIPGRINRIRAHFKLRILNVGNTFNLLKESAQGGVPDKETQDLREEIRTLETCQKLSAWAIEKEIVAPEYREQVGDVIGSLFMPNQDTDL